MIIKHTRIIYVMVGIFKSWHVEVKPKLSQTHHKLNFITNKIQITPIGIPIIYLQVESPRLIKQLVISQCYNERRRWDGGIQQLDLGDKELHLAKSTLPVVALMWTQMDCFLWSMVLLKCKFDNELKSLWEVVCSKRGMIL